MQVVSQQDQFDALLEASHQEKILFCKFSPICPTSFMAQREVDELLKSHSVKSASIDVVKSRALSRSIADQVGVKHESPQAFILEAGKVQWHGSHYDLTREKLAAKL